MLQINIFSGIYEPDNKLSPRPFFPWTEIKCISFKNKMVKKIFYLFLLHISVYNMYSRQKQNSFSGGGYEHKPIAIGFMRGNAQFVSSSTTA